MIRAEQNADFICCMEKVLSLYKRPF